ncbi:MAG: hypothetical protein HUJ98_03620 [Bacteroidaceae bacterium]|nr:hypothetical protein [Bacteroidales bacterium]MCF0185561.1 hypothetical protein [Bacteroidaceae bacterium]
MKKNLFFLCAACAMILTVSCNKDNPTEDPKDEPASLEVTPTELSWTWNDTGAQSINVTASHEWTAKISDETNWILTIPYLGSYVMVAPREENKTAAAVSATVTVTCKDISKTITCTQSFNSAPVADIVDLGLSVDWASWNVGAKSETDFGQYFAWGETAEKTEYSWDTYKWGKETDSAPDYGMTKYNTKDGLTTLEPEDDPATVAWGSKWRTPTGDEIKELLDETKCEWKETAKNGVNGYTVTSKVKGFEGKTIFLPKAAEWMASGGLVNPGQYGYYWSSSRYSRPDCVYSLFISSDDWHSRTFTNSRYYGRTVRAVTNPHPERDLSGGVEAVDLGLPSGTKWASWNVGAKSETDYGSYFAWGETEEKKDYTWNTYKWGIYDGGDYTNFGMKKYNGKDGLKTLEAGDDPATAVWGNKWRTPTYTEMNELLNNCEWTWTTKRDAGGKNVNGYIVTGKNDKSIFLPAAAYRYGTELNEFVGKSGYYWSSTREYPSYAYCIYFFSTDYDPYLRSYSCCSGLSVRAVTK